MTDDDPLDLGEVAADAAAIDALLAGDELPADLRADLALGLLHDLRHDVDAEPIPIAPIGVAPSRSTIVRLSSDRQPARRNVRSGTTVALLTAGALSLGGVAAASTAVPAGNPLYGLGQAVRAAAGTVVDAVTPPQAAPVRPPAASPTPRATPPGGTLAASARSSAAARQVSALLVAAQQMLSEGRSSAATDRLDVAERRLPEVLPEHGAATLTARLAELRRQVVAAAAAPQATERADPAGPPAPTRKPTAKPAPGAKKPAAPPKPAPAGKPAGDKPAAEKKPTAQPEPKADGDEKGTSGDGKDGKDGKEGKDGKDGKGEPGTSAPGQPSKDASAKPRA